MIQNSLGKVSAVDSNMSSLLVFWFELCIEQSWKGLKKSSIHLSAWGRINCIHAIPGRCLSSLLKTSSDGDVCPLQAICASAFPSSPSAGFTLMSYLAFPSCNLRLFLFCPILWICRIDYSFLFCISSFPCWRPLSPSSVGETTLS